VPILTGAGLRRTEALIAALAFPAVFINLGHGQNGFLTAALLGAGFRLLDRRPLLAGALFAVLAYKPQFLLVLPLALLVQRRWRALIGAGAGLVVMTGASILAFGPGAWRAFFDSLVVTRLMSEQGATGFEKIQSVFAAARLLGASVETAYVFQGIVIIVVLAALVRLLLSGADASVKAAATIIAMFLTTPYVLDYDMVALAPALAFLLAHALEKGFAPFEKTLLAAAYVIPLIVRPLAGAVGLPLGALTILTLFASTARLTGSRRPEPSPANSPSGKQL
jgi:alpha-1,2-mannosyltransferase